MNGPAVTNKNLRPTKIAYYISGHGLGHAVRSIQVINELLQLGCDVCVKTTAPAFLFQEGLARPIKVIPEGFDVGLHQLDNIRFDLEKTKDEVRTLLRSAESRIVQEQTFLLTQGISGVVCDIPFIPLTAAARIGVPSVGICNFSWDWFYSHYSREDRDWKPLVKAIRGYYRAADLLLRMPFFGELADTFQRIEDIPLVARRSFKPKGEIRRILGLPKDRKIGLIGYSRLDLSEKAIKKIERLSSDYLFLIKHPLDWRSSGFRRVEEENVSFIDLIREADFIITKPGYGVVSDCLIYGTPMIYSDRGDFPEYPILVEGINKYLSCCYLPKEDLYSGDWRPYLDKLTELPRVIPRMKTNGARKAGKRIIEWIKKSGKRQEA